MSSPRTQAFVVFWLALAPVASAQSSSAQHTDVSATATVTTNGMSNIPAFALDRPAGLLFLYIRRSAFSFDPEFRIGLDGKPWAVVLWTRYRWQHEKLLVSASAHPAINFRATPVVMDGVARDVIVARRYVAGELAATRAFAPNANLGAAYLYLRGVERDVVKHTHFAALRSSVAWSLPRGYSLRVLPQAYYLTMGRRAGYYSFANVILAKESFPVSLSSAANVPIRTSIAAGKEFTWNVSASYTIR